MSSFMGGSNLGLGAGEPSTSPTGPKDKRAQRDTAAATAGKDPSNEQDRIKYGCITDVNSKSMVRVRLLNNKGSEEGSDIVSGTFLPVLNPLSKIHQDFGALSKGQLVRVFWKGKLEPNASTMIEVIANPGHKFLQKDRKSNEINTAPFLWNSGGLVP